MIFEEKDWSRSLTDLINEKVVCRTALSTPGLLEKCHV
jgi:hypothetical protein